MSFMPQINFDVPFAVTSDHKQKEDTCLALWGRVAGYINHVMEANSQLNLVQFNQKVNPSVAQLRQYVTTARQIVNFMSNADGLTHDAARALINCQAALGDLDEAFNAISTLNQDAADDAIAKLNFRLNTPQSF